MSYLEKDGSGYSPFALRDSWGDEIGSTMIDEMMVAEKTRVAGGVFNGTTPDTNFYTGEILYTNKRVQFYIDKVLVYTFTQTTEVICGTRHLRAFAQNTNTGVGSVCSMYIQVMSIITWGNTKTQPKYHFQQGLTAGVLLKTGIGSLHSTVLSTISNNATVTLYDGTSTAGTVIWTTGPMAANTTPFQVPFNTGLQFINGLYLTVTAAACGCLVMYE